MGRLIIGIIIIGIGILILVDAVSKDLKNQEYDSENDNTNVIRADELPKLKASYTFNKYVKKYCENCEFYDGYDMCLNYKHWGTVIQNSIEYCRKNKSFKEK